MLTYMKLHAHCKERISDSEHCHSNMQTIQRVRHSCPVCNPNLLKMQTGAEIRRHLPHAASATTIERSSSIT